MSNRRPVPRSVLVVALLLVAGLVLDRVLDDVPRGPGGGTGGAAAVERAFEEGRSGLWVEVEGRVERVLADDREGSRHQRFILRLPGGHTLLVSHNIDLAPRAPVAVGDEATARGRYEWNEHGGVLHWTHHDPGGREPGGWLRVGGRTVR